MVRVRTVVGELRARPALVDLLVAVVLAVVFLRVPTLMAQSGRYGGGFDLRVTGPDVVLTLVSAAALTQVRRLPLVTLLATGTAALAALLGEWSVNLAQLALVIALYVFASRASRAHALVAAATTSVVLGATWALGLTVADQVWGRHNLILWLWTAAALGMAVQGRRASLAALQDRARRAEETREETALRRVAEDRVRIARELHDAIAHHAAVISVQAGVAEHVVERDPAAAREALHHVRESAKAVLTELQSVLGVLRQDEADLPTAPTPGLDRVGELVASSRAIGTPVTVERSGPPWQLTPAVDLTAFRLVQEALTNVQKHAAGARATVLLSTRGDRLEVTVTNDRPPAGAVPRGTGEGPTPSDDGPTGSGLGLVGMRERVAAAGGQLQTGPTKDGGYRVAAQLPLAPRTDAAASPTPPPPSPRPATTRRADR
ncbi:histidine kinase [Cellulomonas sp. 73-145]|uniref:sensor histidine kinase n=1 Tax=Cellulomonas sp. 73-145 TaxID=1895739 RepID=UPI0025B87F96|nr:histidine kinase [Cellulomonas sp. 73-145]